MVRRGKTVGHQFRVRAAYDCERLDVMAFVLRAALPAAQEVLARAERLVLSERETAQLLDLLEHPPAPTPALIEAARRRLARG